MYAAIIKVYSPNGKLRYKRLHTDPWSCAQNASLEGFAYFFNKRGHMVLYKNGKKISVEPYQSERIKLPNERIEKLEKFLVL